MCLFEGLGKALYTCDFAAFPYLEGGDTGAEKPIETFRREKRYHNSFHFIYRGPKMFPYNVFSEVRQEHMVVSEGIWLLSHKHVTAYFFQRLANVWMTTLVTVPRGMS